MTSLKQHKNRSDTVKLKSNAKRLKTLLKDMRELLLTEGSVDFNKMDRFSWSNRGKYNPFGYDSKAKEPVSAYVRFRQNRLRHKLQRIQKELDYVTHHKEHYERLTPREKEIIQLLVKGNNNPEIAHILSISRYTVEQHRKHINHKLNIKSFSQLIHFSYAFDLV